MAGNSRLRISTWRYFSENVNLFFVVVQDNSNVYIVCLRSSSRMKWRNSMGYPGPREQFPARRVGPSGWNSPVRISLKIAVSEDLMKFASRPGDSESRKDNKWNLREYFHIWLHENVEIGTSVLALLITRHMDKVPRDVRFSQRMGTWTETFARQFEAVVPLHLRRPRGEHPSSVRIRQRKSATFLLNWILPPSMLLLNICEDDIQNVLIGTEFLDNLRPFLMKRCIINWMNLSSLTKSRFGFIHDTNECFNCSVIALNTNQLIKEINIGWDLEGVFDLVSFERRIASDNDITLLSMGMNGQKCESRFRRFCCEVHFMRTIISLQKRIYTSFVEDFVECAHLFFMDW